MLLDSVAGGGANGIEDLEASRRELVNVSTVVLKIVGARERFRQAVFKLGAKNGGDKLER